MEETTLGDLSVEGNLIRECIQKLPDWPPGARTVNGVAPCH